MTYMQPMKATIENMCAHAGRVDRRVFAYSVDTGEEVSADPMDYWHAHDGWVLRDSEGNPMILARHTTQYLYDDEEKDR